MAAYDEDIADSVFLAALMKKHKAAYAAVLANLYTVRPQHRLIINITCSESSSLLIVLNLLSSALCSTHRVVQCIQPDSRGL